MSQSENISEKQIGDAPVSELVAPGQNRRRDAATLLLVCEIENDGPSILFMRRSQRVRNHKGQISFPGGSLDPEDESLEATALREAWEELGIEPGSLRVLGVLPPTDTVVSNFTVYTYVAVPKDKYAPINFRWDGFEVADVFYIPLKALLEPDALRLETWRLGGLKRPMVFYQYQNFVIWGATAYILHNFLNELRAGKCGELLED